jgi:hypothetical protein
MNVLIDYFNAIGQQAKKYREAPHTLCKKNSTTGKERHHGHVKTGPAKRYATTTK